VDGHFKSLLHHHQFKFFSQSGELLGSKKSHLQQIHQITGIDVKALQGNSPSEFSIEKRISWAAGRETKLEEDAAYYLLGILDSHMSLIYGEGRQRVFDRLQRKARKPLNPASFSSGHASWDTESVQPAAQWSAVKSSHPFKVQNRLNPGIYMSTYQAHKMIQYAQCYMTRFVAIHVQYGPWPSRRTARHWHRQAMMASSYGTITQARYSRHWTMGILLRL
jgi:hypothetical protein